jgi:hypothetical protein
MFWRENIKIKLTSEGLNGRKEKRRKREATWVLTSVGVPVPQVLMNSINSQVNSSFSFPYRARLYQNFDQNKEIIVWLTISGTTGRRRTARPYRSLDKTIISSH